VSPTRTPPTDAELVLDGIHAAGITHVASLPDFNLLELIRGLERDERLVHVPVAREEEGIGIATGVFLGGGMPAVVMQNAGLLNTCNALTTTALQFEIPMLLLVWYAGYLGDSAFMRLGEVTEPVLRALGIRSFIPADAEAARVLIPQAVTLSRQGMRPVAVLLTKPVLRKPEIKSAK
jgi:sulfopyruvate decarboxylase subunit alpha